MSHDPLQDLLARVSVKTKVTHYDSERGEEVWRTVAAPKRKLYEALTKFNKNEE